MNIENTNGPYKQRDVGFLLSNKKLPTTTLDENSTNRNLYAS